ncbi:MAG: DNA-directed RNA polymerase [Myxococcales bacterium]|nr:DNA-directed RNA polymerase [Myxococcales bacterium]
MTRSAFLLGSFLALTTGTGCASYVDFTQEMRDQHNLKASDLKNLQFYNSHPITLRREVERGGRQVTSGHKLLVIAGKQIEEVVIEEHTPGVVVGVADTQIEVSFEEGSSMKFSLRGPEPLVDPVVQGGRFATPPDPFPGNGGPRDLEPPRERFFGSGNFWVLPAGTGTVSFQGQSWDAVGQTADAHLVISTESLEEVEEERTVLKGRKL